MQDRDLSGLLLCRRRAMLGAALALVPWAPFPARAEDQANDRTSGPPQTGDHLVFLTGPKKDQPVRSDDLELGGPQAQAYPALLVRTSLNDSQVHYWESAKYVARLRAVKADSNVLLFKVKLQPGGHGGASGRYDRLHDLAFDYAFILVQVKAP